MTCDENVVFRIRRVMTGLPGFSERRMFGGVCFTLSGKMCCGVVGSELMVRVGPDAHADALRQPHARPMDFTGRPMRGFVYVAPPGFHSDAALARWVSRAVQFVSTLEPDRASTPRTRRKRRARAST